MHELSHEDLRKYENFKEEKYLKLKSDSSP